MPRSATGYTIKETWDTLGMRATRSDDTLLEECLYPRREHYARAAGWIRRRRPVYFLGFCLVPVQHWQRVLRHRPPVLDLTIESVKGKRSLAMSGHTMDHHPAVQMGIADMVLLLEAIEPQLERTAEDLEQRGRPRPQLDDQAAWRQV